MARRSLTARSDAANRGGERLMPNRWHTDPRTCSHANADICPTCDFDGYYAATYDDCPWREVGV